MTKTTRTKAAPSSEPIATPKLKPKAAAATPATPAAALPSAAAADSPAPPVAPTKRDLILSLMRQPDGATLDQMVAATGWLPHTTRAMLTGLRKKGHRLASDKIDGVRRYTMVLDAGADV